jgi:hypothetical protein
MQESLPKSGAFYTPKRFRHADRATPDRNPYSHGVMMPGVNQKAPMIALPVTIAMTEATPFQCEIFLSPYSHRHEGHETIEEYLNSSRSFFPTNEDGVPKLINREQLLWLRATRSVTEQGAYGVSEAHIILELIDGMRVEGNVESNRPVGQARISDILNSPHEAFVCLRTDEDACFVNKRFIRQVILR